jgi:hypothetical protein
MVADLSLFFMKTLKKVNLTAGPRLKIRKFDKARNITVWSHAFTAWKRKVVTLCVENKGTQKAQRCVARLSFTSVPENVSHLEKNYILDWRGITTQSTQESRYVTIGETPKILEIVFSDSDRNTAGCWMALPDARSGTIHDKVYLPEGVYDAVVEIDCENGKGDINGYRIVSPGTWDGLWATEIRQIGVPGFERATAG